MQHHSLSLTICTHGTRMPFTLVARCFGATARSQPALCQQASHWAPHAQGSGYSCPRPPSNTANHSPTWKIQQNEIGSPHQPYTHLLPTVILPVLPTYLPYTNPKSNWGPWVLSTYLVFVLLPPVLTGRLRGRQPLKLG